MYKYQPKRKNPYTGFCFVISVFLVLIISQVYHPHSVVLAQESLPRFERADCPIEVPGERTIECGYLVTFEDYDNPEGRTIRTAVIIIHSRNANPAQEALLFTEGGPGYSSLGSVWWLADSEFANNRDIVILEQRGNLYAEPSLACDFSIWMDEKEGDTPCLDSLRQRGIELEHYTTASIAADINALMHVLDYEKWNLYGTSYSTRLMQIVMTKYPNDIRSVVLQSLSPITDTRYQHDPEHTARALNIMFDDCSNDPVCSEAYPDLASEFYTLVRKLNDNPVTFEITSRESNGSYTYEVDGGTLIGWMDGSAFYGPAYTPYETAYLPLLIDEVAKGNTDLLYPWVKNYISRWGNDLFNWGLYFTINCQDDAPSINIDMIEVQTDAYPELVGYYRFRDELAICDAWALEAVPPLAGESAMSDIPVLILAGRYDPITPPEWSRTAISHLGNSTFVEFPSLGHSVLGNSLCAKRVTAAFLNNPTAAPDLRCLQDEPAPQFVVPSEIIITPSMYEIHYDEFGYSKLEENIFLCSGLMIVATGAISLIGVFLKLVLKRQERASDAVTGITLPLLIILGVTTLVWGYAFRMSLHVIASTTPNVLRFGLPVEYWWVYVMLMFIGLMVLILLVLTLRAWRRSDWSLIGRIALSLTATAGLVFISVLARLGLFTALFR